jgi:aminopeptidase S
MWERANPEETSHSGTVYQQGTTVSGSYDLVTEGSAGSGVGSYDIDGGVTSIRSPNITLPSGTGITLSFSYYLAHYSNGSSDDFLRVTIVGSTSTVVLEELAAGNIDAAAWESFSTSLDAYAGQTIYILIEAADGGSASLIEAAIDDVVISQ